MRAVDEDADFPVEEELTDEETGTENTDDSSPLPGNLCLHVRFRILSVVLPNLQYFFTVPPKCTAVLKKLIDPEIISITTIVIEVKMIIVKYWW